MHHRLPTSGDSLPCWSLNKRLATNETTNILKYLTNYWCSAPPHIHEEYDYNRQAIHEFHDQLAAENTFGHWLTTRPTKPIELGISWNQPNNSFNLASS
jgi:hypothetical protein